MTYWDHYCLIVSLYALASASGMGLVVPASAYGAAEDGSVSWRAAHIVAFFTAYLPLGMAFVSLADNMTFGVIKSCLFWVEGKA